MKPNPGGTLTGEAIVNREKENITCQKDDYWEENDIINRVKSHMAIDNEPVKEALDLVWNDHYLVREIKDNRRTYKFRYSILLKWWKVNRG